MLEEIYLERSEKIDEIIKKAITKVEPKIKPINENEREENKELLNKIEENYNIKISSICKEIYILGFKDGMNLILEAKEK